MILCATRPIGRRAAQRLPDRTETDIKTVAQRRICSFSPGATAIEMMSCRSWS